MGSSILSSLGAALHSLQNPYFSQRASQSSSKGHPALQAFESEQAERLEQLKQIGDTAYLNLGWLRDSMSVVLFSHSSVEELIPNLQTPLTEKDYKLIEEYMDDSVKLLDVCNVLKEVISDIEHYLMLVQLALHYLDLKESVNEAKFVRAKNALADCVEAMKKKDEEVSRQGQQRSKLETCSSMLRRMGEKLNTPCATDASKSSALFNAMYGAKVTTIFICGVLAAALSVKPRRSLAVLHVVSQPLWSAPLLRLQQKVKEEIEKRKAKGAVALLHELDRVDGVVKDLQKVVENILSEKAASQSREREELKILVEALGRSSEELQTGLQPLQQQINELFRMLVSIRVALLDALSHSGS